MKQAVYIQKEVAKILKIPASDLGVLHKYLKIGNRINKGYVIYNEKDIKKLKEIISSQ